MRIIGRFLLVFFAAELFFSGFAAALMIRRIRASETREILGLASIRSAHLAEDLDEVIRRLGGIAVLESASRQWRDAVGEDDGEFIPSRLRMIRDSSPVLANAFFADSRGFVVHSVRRSSIGGFAGTEPLETGKAGEPHFETSVGPAPDGYPVLTVSSVIRNEAGEPAGYLGLEINAAVLGREAMDREDLPFLVCILDSAGVVVGNSETGKIFEKAPPIPDPLEGRSLVSSFPTGSEEEYLLVEASLEAVPWTVLYFIPYELVEAKIGSFLGYFASGAGGAALFMAAVVSVFLISVVVKPLDEAVGEIRERLEGSFGKQKGRGAAERLQLSLDALLSEFDRVKALRDAVSAVRDSVFSALPALIAVAPNDGGPPVFLGGIPERLKSLAEVFGRLLENRTCDPGVDPVSSVLCEMENGTVKPPVLKRGTVSLPGAGKSEVLVCGAPAGSGDGAVLVIFDQADIGLVDDVGSDFLAAVSHEFRTPLNGIAGLAQLIKEDGLSSDQAEHIALLEEAVGTLDGMITEIQDYSRLVRKKSALIGEPIQLSDAAVFLKTAYGGKAAAKGLEFRIGIEGEDVFVGDRSGLMRIAGNLVDNAVKYTDAGIVNIRLQSAGSLLIIVDDTGEGIPEEAMKNVFKAFSQLPDPQKGATRGGLGLGLAVVEGLVRLWGGKITVSSTAGKGSTVVVSLPPLRPEREA